MVCESILAQQTAAPEVSVPAGGRTTEERKHPQGGVVDRLPAASELGASWTRQLSLLVDSQSSPEEFFAPESKPELRERIRKQIRPSAHCQMFYLLNGSLRLDAWVTRHLKVEEGEAQWKNLKESLSKPVQPDSGEGRRLVKVDGIETLVFEARSGCTVWARSGAHTLALNLFNPGPVPDEFFKTASVFLKKLQTSVPSTGGVPRSGAEFKVPAEDGRRVVHAMGDLYVAVQKADPQRVQLSAPRHATASDPRCYFNITNHEQSPILIWNVRVQVKKAGSIAGSDGGWETIRSDYPACVSALAAGATAEECVEPPRDGSWRVCMIYTRQPVVGEGRTAAGLESHGEFELVSEIIQQSLE